MLSFAARTAKTKEIQFGDPLGSDWHIVSTENHAVGLSGGGKETFRAFFAGLGKMSELAISAT